MLIIFGEAHFKKKSVEDITAEIIRRKPDYLIHELVYDAKLTPSTAAKALKSCDGKSICDPQTNKDLVELCVKEGFTLVGCDLSPVQLSRFKNPIDGFKARETRMVEVLKKYQHENAIAVVGDAHLRTTNKEIGFRSLIQDAVKSGELKAIILRTDKKFRELD